MRPDAAAKGRSHVRKGQSEGFESFVDARPPRPRPADIRRIPDKAPRARNRTDLAQTEPRGAQPACPDGKPDVKREQVAASAPRFSRQETEPSCGAAALRNDADPAIAAAFLPVPLTAAAPVSGDPPKSGQPDEAGKNGDGERAEDKADAGGDAVAAIRPAVADRATAVPAIAPSPGPSESPTAKDGETDAIAAVASRPAPAAAAAAPGSAMVLAREQARVMAGGGKALLGGEPISEAAARSAAGPGDANVLRQSTNLLEKPAADEKSAPPPSGDIRQFTSPEPAQRLRVAAHAPQTEAAQPGSVLTQLAEPVAGAHPAAHAPAAGATGAAQPRLLAADVGVPMDGLAVEIAARSKDGQNRFEIRLDPPELGRISVQLDVDASGNVVSRLVADRADTLDLLRREAPTLERALQSAGLKTDGGLEFSLRDHSFGRGQDSHAADRRDVPNAAAGDDDRSPVEAMQRRYIRLAGFGGGVDIHV